MTDKQLHSYSNISEEKGVLSEGTPTLGSIYENDQQPANVNDVYDNLFEAMCNTVMKSIESVGKLKHPVDEYIHKCLEHIFNDIMPSTPVQIPSGQSCHPNPQGSYTAQGSIRQSSSQHDSTSNKRKSCHDQEGSGQISGHDDTMDPSRKRNIDNQLKVSKKVRTEHDASFSCPFRKRNPLRFNIRNTKGNCATMAFPSLPSLKCVPLQSVVGIKSSFENF